MKTNFMTKTPNELNDGSKSGLKATGYDASPEYYGTPNELKTLEERYQEWVISRGTSDSNYIQVGYDACLAFIESELQANNQRIVEKLEKAKQTNLDGGAGDFSKGVDSAYRRAIQIVTEEGV